VRSIDMGCIKGTSADMPHRMITIIRLQEVILDNGERQFLPPFLEGVLELAPLYPAPVPDGPARPRYRNCSGTWKRD
jgi:hypothetical protein